MSYKLYQFTYDGGSRRGAMRSVLVGSDNDTATQISGIDRLSTDTNKWRRFDRDKMRNVNVFDVEVIETKDDVSAQKVAKLSYGALVFGNVVVTKTTLVPVEATVSFHTMSSSNVAGYICIEYDGKKYEIPTSNGHPFTCYATGGKCNNLKDVINALHKALNS